VNIEKLRQRLSNHMGKEFKLAYESVSLEQIKAAISFP
jgi:hypothetical protein